MDLKCPIILVLLSFISIVSGYKILFLVPFSGHSHWLQLQNFVKELLKRGHEVTAIVNYPINNFKSPNYTEILIDPPFNMSTILSQEEAQQRSDESYFEKIRSFDKFCTESGEYGLNHSNVQKIIHSEDLKFDLVINSDFYHESWFMFAYKFNAPFISICPYEYSDSFDRAMGLLTPISHVPNRFLPYGDDMSYLERVHNVIVSAYEWAFRNWVLLPKQNAIAQRYFGHLAKPGLPLPNVGDFYQNISMIFVNSHPSISKPRPLMPGIIQYGGAHIKPPKPLPADLQQFLDDSKYGVVFFSLGSHLQSSKLPKEKIDIFVNALGKLKQRVIWKFENESYKVPPNILIRKWLPQSDILAHPNVVLFIAHGGISGLFEGTARGVPMMFIPFFADQQRNALKSVASGNALSLEFSKLTSELFEATLQEMINNKAYLNRAKELAVLFNDNLMHPLDEAIFWIEYVIRSKGAKHLKSYAVNMSWFSYLLLDIFIIPVIAIFIIYLALKSISKSFISSDNKKRKKIKTKKTN
ncbi:UDP-glucuronosyltransferase 2B15-like [Contarinia nasturtii]|uniref:UDP-glucuronosyltransferase 2B15-like n=1 Tax=Contarinia nasturtii TaxID=265458 RepID=UPI0012D46EF4|nr:UDP-glucuronosyltransferase 2B15-like [Contarinia nasturtii]